MLKVGLIGCGKITDSHASQIQRIQGCEIVGACDREPLMADQLCERFNIKFACSEVDELLDRCCPDVVHITTPPQSHFELAKTCLKRDCHVYVEKPFTVSLHEAEELIRLANEVNRKITVGHDLQYSHAARRMRRIVEEGYLGGAVVHMESIYCYDLSDPSYAKALLADKGHWVRRLPGKLLHNIISHGLARITEFLSDDSPSVVAQGFTSSVLKSIGETEIIDELRVVITESKGTSAYFTFSSQMRPPLNQFRIYGPKNGLILDENHQTLICCKGARYKSYSEKFIPALNLGVQYVSNCFTNLRLFAANDFHMKAGMKCLIETFYRCIEGGGPLPLSYREIILTAKLLDAIFAALRQNDRIQGKT
jgi:predicted dehydrogenase